MRLASEALEDGQAGTGAMFAEGHEDAGKDEGAEQGEQAAADAGDEAEGSTGEIADFRLHALHKGGQIVMRLAPHSVKPPANDGPVRNRLGRGRDLQRVLLHGLDQGPDGVAQRTHHHRDGHDEHGDPEQHQQGRGKPGPSAEMGRDAQVQGIEGHREDHGPDRKREEGRQNAVAEQHHSEEKRGTDQHIEQAAREASFEVHVGRRERCHGGSDVFGVCRFV